MSTFHLFVTTTAAGIAAMLPLVPRGIFGRRFFVLMSLIAVLLIGLATLDRGLEIGYWHFACAACLVAYNVLLPREPGVDPVARGAATAPRATAIARGTASFALAGAIASGLAAVVLDGLALADSAPPAMDSRVAAAPAACVVAHALTSTFLLGATLVSMVLGHWYLVSRKLSFTPLRRLTLALSAALGARIAAIVVAAAVQWTFWTDLVAAEGLTGFLLSDGVFLLSRALFGIFVPAVLVPLVWRCVRIESNQSATGILYVLVAFVIFGELLAKHFLVNLRVVI